MDVIKRLPDELRRLELGQIFNGKTNEFIDYNCLDLEQAGSNDMLKISNKEVTESFSFSHKSNSGSQSSALNIAGGVKGQGWGVSLSASYAHYNEKASASKNQVIKAEAYKVKTASIELKNFANEPGKIFEILRESTFRKEWEKIKNETSAPAKKKLIIDFKQKWGTGMIVKLDLLAGAVADIKFESNSDKEKSVNLHEVGAKLESSLVSGEGKLSISGSAENLNLSVNQVGTTVCFPSDDIDAYRKYVDEQVKDLKKYIEKQEVQPKDPEFKGAGAIKPIKLEELVLTKSDEKIKTNLQKKIMERMKPLRQCFINTTDEKLIKAMDLFSRIEEDLPEIYMKGNAEFRDDFDNLKASFKNDLLEILNDDQISEALQKRSAEILKLSIYPEGKKAPLFSENEKRTIKEKLKP